MESETTAFSFSDFPEDVQLCILSFLNQSELSTFASTSKRFLSMCRDDERLWFSLCDRRWGSNTLINKWGNGKISYKHLYGTLHEFENLIGFWRRSGIAGNSPSLVFFEWGPFYIMGSRVEPSKTGTYEVIKMPFLWISLSSKGEFRNYIDPEGKFELSDTVVVDSGELGIIDYELIPVNVNFMGKCHVVIEASVNSPHGQSSSSSSSPNKEFMKVPSSGNVRGEDREDLSGSPGSFPDRMMSEIYQHFANWTSPGGNGLSRRQRRREKERQGRRKMEPEHLVKIVNCSPTPARPLQGLWKGFSDDLSLDFYLTTYDDIGGLACRRVGDSFSGYNPVFWTSDTTLSEPPFPAQEEYEYENRIHLRPPAEADGCLVLRYSRYDTVTRMLHMTSSYDLVIPGSVINPRQVEGRIWQYGNGTYGFGFLRNNYIIDLKHVAQGGRLLDTMEFSSN
ncbi:OLC1v1016876C1 [Oldenlandia corymbosa var. corymbosa]|uniref:F-box protein n=1 Tax=Oldenlandia corymbosa var. corymbosa TaxID=529605 RepID=A0AAV1E895_OLDCO|nr:OLC1v1016876C1 [Oldenlandia corymbosa var. corymbosa]